MQEVKLIDINKRATRLENITISWIKYNQQSFLSYYRVYFSVSIYTSELNITNALIKLFKQRNHSPGQNKIQQFWTTVHLLDDKVYILVSNELLQTYIYAHV